MDDQDHPVLAICNACGHERFFQKWQWKYYHPSPTTIVLCDKKDNKGIRCSGYYELAPERQQPLGDRV